MSEPPAHHAPGSEHSPDAPLSIHAMTVAYHRRPVLWDIDLDVPRGALLGIVGPNGAGKSTLVKAVLDLVPMLSEFWARGRVEIWMHEGLTANPPSMGKLSKRCCRPICKFLFLLH